MKTNLGVRNSRTRFSWFSIILHISKGSHSLTIEVDGLVIEVAIWDTMIYNRNFNDFNHLLSLKISGKARKF